MIHSAIHDSTLSPKTTMRILLLVFITLFSFLMSCHQKKISNDLFLPDDLEATLWAQSPLFYNPTNMDVDIKGRIWVTEAVNYRNFNNDSTKFLHHQKGDRVMILQDTDGDGEADVSKVFVEDKDLISPLGIASPRTLFNGPYGFFDPATETGEINIPSISLSTLRDLLAARAYVSLRDILRHEYAHAIEHHHSELIHGDDFEDAFGVAHDVHAEAEFDPNHYVSPYAATCVGQEDYAETFMMFVKFGGVLPPHFNTRTIRRKWRFMARLAKTVGRHQRKR